MATKKLFSPAKLGKMTLQNRIVMAPMTRSRCVENNAPGPLVAEYYGQRASSLGLVVTEGTSPSPNGLGYARIPGVYSPEQIKGWKAVTDAVHAKGAKTFLQIMHCGRISHQANLPKGGVVMAPSAIKAGGKMWTDNPPGMQDHPVPKEMTTKEIKATIEEFKVAAANAVEKAGFDGIELHSANGYLLEQFLRPSSNTRKDAYGGSIEGRSRFLLELLEATSSAIGSDRIGVRLSPFSTFNDMPVTDAAEHKDDYRYVARMLGQRAVAYMHLVRGPGVPNDFIDELAQFYGGTTILCGGYDAESAEKDIQAGKAALVAFGRPLISNPDLLQRFKKAAPLAPSDVSTYYTPGPKGYTDYQPLA